MLEVLEAFGRGERPAFEDEFLETGATDRLNAREEQRFLDTPGDEVLARFEDLHRRVVGEIGSMTDEGWAAAYPFDPDDATIGDGSARSGSDDGGFRTPRRTCPTCAPTSTRSVAEGSRGPRISRFMNGR